MSTFKINGIPVYNAIIRDEEDGMLKVSLVDSPAVMSDFQVLRAQERPALFSVEDEERRLLFGVVMRADFPIYRVSPSGAEYYLVFKAGTIREMAEKYLLENRANDVNRMHMRDSDVEGVDMIQFFLKDTARGVSPAGFEDIADGSLFAEYHIVNDDVWAQVKAGAFKGFSLEGQFGLAEDQGADCAKDAAGAAGCKSSALKYISSKIKSMTKLERIKAALAKILVECASMTTDKGVLVWDGEEPLKAGDAVSVQGESGEVKTPAEDGEYVTEDGKTIIVEDGKVSEIRVAEETPAEEEGKVEAAEEETGRPEEEGGKSVEERVAALEKAFDALCECLGVIRLHRTELAKIQARLNVLEKTPAASAAHEEFKKSAAADVADAKVARAVRLASAMRK